MVEQARINTLNDKIKDSNKKLIKTFNMMQKNVIKSNYQMDSCNAIKDISKYQAKYIHCKIIMSYILNLIQKE